MLLILRRNSVLGLLLHGLNKVLHVLECIYLENKQTFPNALRWTQKVGETKPVNRQGREGSFSLNACKGELPKDGNKVAQKTLAMTHKINHHHANSPCAAVPEGPAWALQGQYI